MISTLLENNASKVAVECYGGGLWHTWFDRDLTLAGCVILDNKVAFEQMIFLVEHSPAGGWVRAETCSHSKSCASRAQPLHPPSKCRGAGQVCTQQGDALATNIGHGAGVPEQIRGGG